MKKKRIARSLAAGLTALLLLAAALPQARSLAVMSVYSRMNERDSLMRERGLRIRMPGGFSTLKKDWYPFVMTFEAGRYFGRSIGQSDVRLTILYNFGAFGLSPRSSLYNTASPYYNSFYGAYLVSQDEGLYGFDADGALLPEAMAAVPRYDFFQLVLGDFGLRSADRVFDWAITAQEEGVSLAGFDGWTRLTATLRVNGSAHAREGFVQSYLQYGAPQKRCSASFEPVDLTAVLYVRPFPEEGVSVFLYALCADGDALAETDTLFLQKTKIVQKH